MCKASFQSRRSNGPTHFCRFIEPPTFTAGFHNSSTVALQLSLALQLNSDVYDLSNLGFTFPCRIASGCPILAKLRRGGFQTGNQKPHKAKKPAKSTHPTRYNRNRAANKTPP